MSRLIPMPSPRGTNHARAYLLKVPVAADSRGMAIDELPNGSRLTRQEIAARADAMPNGFAETRADLPDPAKEKEFGEDDQARVSNLADFLRGKNLSEDDVRAAIERMLSAEGYGQDDIRTACDALGIGASARLGGAPAGSNFGGALHGEVRQPARDRNFRIAEEALGQQPCRDARRPSGGRDSFEFLYGRQDRVAEIRAASRPRRRASSNQVAMDSARETNFYTRFPGAKRIRGAI
jgi:hypothetical protein